MNFSVKRVAVHVLCILLFLSLPFFFSPDPLDAETLRHNPFVWREFISYLLITIFFYTNYYYLIPSFYFGKKQYWFYAGVLAGFLAVSFIPQLMVPHSIMHGGPMHGNGPPPPPDHGPHRPWLFDLGHNLFLFLGVVFASLALKINSQWKQAQQEKFKAELSYLRAQINPHFLFNTLNSIYSLAIRKSDNTAPAVVKLSGMMRYVTTESKSEFVSLDKELNYISNYIDLQKIRLGETVVIDFAINGSSTGKQIAPLLLIPFIENAFKYGVNPEENSAIKITINIAETNLNLQVFNHKVRHTEDTLEEDGGTGIGNTAQRLNLVYGGKHRLVITDNEKDFLVSLEIDLQ